MNISKENNWSIINSYFRDNENYLVKHHLDSYNDFIINKIPQTLQQYNPLIIYKDKNKQGIYKHTIKIFFGDTDGDKVYVSQPIIYDKITETKRHMYPNEARLKNLDYASHIFCDVKIEYHTLGEEEHIVRNFKKIELGKIPIMLKSKHCILYGQTQNTLIQMGECPYDLGGYFIVGGMEKVMVSHERKVENKIYIIQSKSQDSKYKYGAQIKSVPEEGFKYARTTSVYIRNSDMAIDVLTSGFNHPIPLFILFRALGIEADKDIIEYIVYDVDTEISKHMMEILRNSIEKAQIITSQGLALSYLSQITNGRSDSYVMRVLLEDIFPHIGQNFTKKIYYLGLVVRRLLLVTMGLLEETDRDSYVYKRVDLSGFLMANLFRDGYKQLLRNCKIQIDTLYRFNANYANNIREIVNDENLNVIFDMNKIEEPTMKAFKIGTILGKKGLIQALTRVSSLSTIAHLRRVNTPNDLVMINQRRLHNTQYGIFDCVDSPDGSNIGIKKHLSIMSHITFGCDAKPIIDLLRENGLYYLDEITPKMVTYSTKVFVNGNWIGIHNDPKSLVQHIRLLRRNAFINIFTSISWDIQLKDIHIHTDGGRVCRPFYIVKNKQILANKEIVDAVQSRQLTWHDLLIGFSKRKTPFDYYNCAYLCPEKEINTGKKTINLEVTQGIIEYVDVEESGTSLFHVDIFSLNQMNELYKYTHCEIHPYLTYGASGFCIPFGNSNQLPRNVFSCGHSRQSVGIYTTNYRNRFDTFAYVNYYPQKPLITTRLSKNVYENKLPAGMNAIVAIACHGGYNQEDSIIINKSALDRGLYRTAYFRSYTEMELQDRKANKSEEFYNPLKINEAVELKKGYHYDKLDDTGIVKEGEYITDNDIIVGKYTVTDSGEVIDLSTTPNREHYGRVEKVFLSNYNSDGHRVCKIRIANERVPTFGDKFASRHGQKGTVGIVYRQEDMPFTKDGIVPDIIINPHAIPSRMTIGQLLECILGKVCSVIGSIGDATPYENYDVGNHIADLLESYCNYERHGNEILYNGRNGKQMKTEIFMGPTYYQRLKLMTKDKVNSRDTGSVTLKERQPPSGKAIGGGLRIGEMERDAIISHGLAQFLKESMLERSDKYSIYVDNKTGKIAVVNPKDNIYISPSCDGPLEFKGSTVNNIRIRVKNKNCMDFTKVEVPYCFKLLLQECESMGLNMRLVTDKANIDSVQIFDVDVGVDIDVDEEEKRKKEKLLKSTIIATSKAKEHKIRKHQEDLDKLLRELSESEILDDKDARNKEYGLKVEVKSLYSRYPQIRIGSIIERNDFVDLLQRIYDDSQNSSIEDIEIEFNFTKKNENEYLFVKDTKGPIINPNILPRDIGLFLDSLEIEEIMTYKNKGLPISYDPYATPDSPETAAKNIVDLQENIDVIRERLERKAPETPSELTLVDLDLTPVDNPENESVKTVRITDNPVDESVKKVRITDNPEDEPSNTPITKDDLYGRFIKSKQPLEQFGGNIPQSQVQLQQQPISPQIQPKPIIHSSNTNQISTQYQQRPINTEDNIKIIKIRPTYEPVANVPKLQPNDTNQYKDDDLEIIEL